MSYTFSVLCRPEIAAGFALAGVKPIEAGTPEAGIAAVRALLARPDAGVVLVEDTFYDALPEDVRRLVGRRPLPMLVPFPGPAWTERAEAAEAYIVELLRQVIGYRVRLK
ncbi:MAG TPA: V-type ATP synthase subunit F [Gemmatimonadales bacterium]|nr:V-type ATP synthase subunit F [Gemmatimonadales bacterium]